MDQPEIRATETRHLHDLATDTHHVRIDVDIGDPPKDPPKRGGKGKLVEIKATGPGGK